jgi:hypothetical protein
MVDELVSIYSGKNLEVNRKLSTFYPLRRIAANLFPQTRTTVNADLPVLQLLSAHDQRRCARPPYEGAFRGALS